MQEIQIGNHFLPYIHYKSHIVITLEIIDQLHGRLKGTAKRSFCRNRHRFVKDEDFIYVTPTTAKAIGLQEISLFEGQVLLITETGYMLFVKILKDDMAYHVQKYLGFGFYERCIMAAAAHYIKLNSNHKKPQITREIEAQVKALQIRGMTHGKIAKLLGISFSAVSQLVYDKYPFSINERERQAINPDIFIKEMLDSDGASAAALGGVQ